MPLSLPTLLDLDTRLQRAAARLEPHTPRTGRGRVEGQIVRDIAFPRYLVWRSFLQRKPTQASFATAAKRLRGYMLWAIALAAQAQGLPLPVKNGAAVPHWALRPLPQAPAERVALADIIRAEGDDPVDYWDTYGADLGGVYDADMIAAAMNTEAAYQAWLQETFRNLDFEFWLADVAMNDMAVLQMLDAAYNANAATTAGQELIDEAGLAGDFNLYDPNVMSFLQAQAGTWISSIDDTTRSFIARTLYDGLGGDYSHVIALSPEQLANEVRSIWGQLGNNLEEMSRYRARMITVTELARAETFGQFASIMGLGIKNKEWMTTSGACIICMGNQSMGAIPLMQPFPDGSLAPLAHPLCFVPGTMVDGPAINAGTMRPYVGSVVTITIDGGAELTGTPNHPIRTPHGWVPLGQLQPGDQVVTHNMEAPQPIETAVGRGAATLCMEPMRRESFHGDGIDGTAAATFMQPAPTHTAMTIPEQSDVVLAVTTHGYSGPVFTLETVAGWYIANNIVVQNCRCSLAPSPDANDPREGMYTYPADALNALLDNPSMAYWPNADGSAESVDLSAFGQPATPTQVDWRSPQAAMLGYDTLPDSLKGLIDPQGFNSALALARFGQSLAALVDERVVQPRLNPSEHTPQDTALESELITLDSLLGAMDDADLQTASDDVPQTLSDRWAAMLDDLRSSLQDDTGDEG